MELTKIEKDAIEDNLKIFERDYMENFIDSFKEELKSKLE